MNVPPCSPSNGQAMPPDRPDPNTMNVRRESARRSDVPGGQSRPPARPGEAARAEELRSRLPAQSLQPREVNVTLLKAIRTALQSGMLVPERSYTLRRLMKQLDRIDTLISPPPGIGSSRMRDLPGPTEKALLLLRKVVSEEFTQMHLRAQVSGIGKGSEEFAFEEDALFNRKLELRRQWNELPRQDPKAAPEPGEAIGPLVDQLGALTSFWQKWLAPTRND